MILLIIYIVKAKECEREYLQAGTQASDGRHTHLVREVCSFGWILNGGPLNN